MKTIELKIKGSTDQFYGKSQHNQKEIHVIGALDGEVVEASIMKKTKKAILATVTKVLTPSEQRQEAPCPHFLNCSGCTLQHLSSKNQLELKAKWLENEINFPVQFTQTNPWHYRRRARLSVKYDAKKDDLLIGFREHKGWYVARMDGCLILPKAIHNQLPVIKTALSQISIKEAISQIEVSSIGGSHALIIRHLLPFSNDDINHLNQLENDTSLTVYTQGNDLTIHKPGLPDQIFLPQPMKLNNNEYHANISDFVQVNEEANLKLIEFIVNHLKQGCLVHDFFCGMGNISLAIANKAKKVIGYELSDTMVEKAKINAVMNHIDHCHFIQMDLFKAQIKSPEMQSTDAIILDPPRSGAEDLCQLLSKQSVSQIIYVSCNAKTLIRDLEILSEKYQLVSAHIFDMFSQTSHFETCVILEPKSQ
jgi:23S rRNA (uracil1939-C5)-methyltransferase